MARIGTFGRQLSEDELGKAVPTGDDFVYFDQPIRLRSSSHVNPLPMMEFARLIQAPTPTRSVIAQSVLYGLLEACVHPDDWEMFRALTILHGNREDAMQELVELAYALYGAWSGYPFQQQPDSSNGQPTEKTESSSGTSLRKRSRRSKRRESSATTEVQNLSNPAVSSD